MGSLFDKTLEQQRQASKLFDDPFHREPTKPDLFGPHASMSADATRVHHHFPSVSYNIADQQEMALIQEKLHELERRAFALPPGYGVASPALGTDGKLNLAPPGIFSMGQPREHWLKAASREAARWSQFVNTHRVYPTSLLNYVLATNTYRFTKPAPHVLSLVSGVSRDTIMNAVVHIIVVEKLQVWQMSKLALKTRYALHTGLGAVLLFMMACQGNACYIEDGTSLLRRCGGGGVFTVTISDSLNGGSTYIGWKGGSSCPEMLNLAGIDSNYLIIARNDTLVDNSQFTLKPASHYKIMHQTVGDASDFMIRFTTDKKGRIVWSSQTDCP